MYNNFISRTNPGLIIIMIDQSAYMATINEQGIPLAEMAANIANNVIYDFVLRLSTMNSDAEEIVRRSLKLNLIGYGGPNDEAYVICCRWIDEIAVCYPIGKQTTHTREGIFEHDCIEVFHPVAEGIPDISGAFSIAKDLVNDWIVNHNKAEAPVPIIINISNNYTQDNGRTVNIVNEISKMSIPDGSPLIINCSVSDNTKLKTNYSKIPTCKDKFRLLEVISSKIPSDLSERMDGLWNNEGRMFIENITSFQDVSVFLWTLFHHPTILKNKYV